MFCLHVFGCIDSFKSFLHSRHSDLEKCARAREWPNFRTWVYTPSEVAALLQGTENTKHAHAIWRCEWVDRRTSYEFHQLHRVVEVRQKPENFDNILSVVTNQLAS